MSSTRSGCQSHSAVVQNSNVKHKSTEGVQRKEWNPAKFLSRIAGLDDPYAVVILNQPIENVHLFLQVCRQALYIVCADGGANRVKDLNLSETDEISCKIDAICGDLDSLRPEVGQYYKDLGSHIIEDPDQYSTDFTKCLKHINNIATAPSRHSDEKPRFEWMIRSSAGTFDVAVIGGFGGRADQAFSQMHHLYSASDEKGKHYNDIYLIGAESIVFLLHKGLNRIQTPVAPKFLGECIGIIPIARPSIITTRGLEWDVDKWPTEFGTQISTSNHIRASHVEIESSEKVLFTIEIAQKPGQEKAHHRAKRRKISHDLDNSNPAAELVEAANTLSTGMESSSTSSKNQSNGPVPSVSSADIAKRLDRVENLLDRMVTMYEETSENQQIESKANATVLQTVLELLRKPSKKEEMDKARLAES
ncbi:MAG: hypothetical protein Q9187_007919 [Circinaria calcarea]